MKTVLIVDDNTTLAYFTALSLQRGMEDVEVITAVSCREARTRAAQVCPSVMIVDIKLPDGDGLELALELSEHIPQMAAIVTSGNELPKGVHDRFFGFLRKPYGADVLVNLVRQALNQTARTDSPLFHQRRDQKQSARPSVYDSHHVRNRLAALLAGLRALQADLKAEADDPCAVRQLAGEHVDRLFGIALELSDIMKQSDDR